MLMNQNPQAKLNQASNNNKIFSRLSSYISMEDESNQLLPPAIEEEILTDYFITKYGLTLEQINRDLAICRELEGDE